MDREGRMEAHAIRPEDKDWIFMAWHVLLWAVLMSTGTCSGPAPAYADHQGDGHLAAMMYITGVTEAEDLDESTFDELTSYLSTPLAINYASVSRLTGSGLMSGYQIASLVDYRSRAGDVLSVAELAAIDGFGKEYAEALSHFISFESSEAPGRPSSSPDVISGSVTLKSSARRKENASTEYSYGFKSGLLLYERLEIGITGRAAYSPELQAPEVLSFNITYYGRKRLGKVIAGDFNVRTGQGLALWSGFSMAGLSAPGSYSKRPSGISPYRSYSGEGSLRGIAADFSSGRFTFTSFLAVEGLRDRMAGIKDIGMSLLPGLNIGYSGKNGQVSITAYAQTLELNPCSSGITAGNEGSLSGAGAYFSDLKISADARYSISGNELFAEAAFDAVSISAAALAGSRFPVGENLDMAVSLRYYPPGFSAVRSGAVRSGTRCSNEYAVSFSGEFRCGSHVSLAGKEGFGSSEIRHKGIFGVDASYAPEPRYGTDRPTRQLKILFDYDWRISPAAAVSCRVSERLRDWDMHSRTDVRTDFRYSDGRVSLTARINALLCRSVGLLSYLEGGYADGPVSVYLRGGLFRIDAWDDRIYVYERDAPGNFNVPAYYGRGYWAALTAGIRCTRWMRAYFRASYQDCPWHAPVIGQRPGKWEIKLQLALRL